MTQILSKMTTDDRFDFLSEEEQEMNRLINFLMTYINKLYELRELCWDLGHDFKESMDEDFDDHLLSPYVFNDNSDLDFERLLSSLIQTCNRNDLMLPYLKTYRDHKANLIKALFDESVRFNKVKARVEDLTSHNKELDIYINLHKKISEADELFVEISKYALLLNTNSGVLS